MRRGGRGRSCELVSAQGDDQIVAFVEASGGVTPAGVLEAARLTLPATMLPDQVLIVESFPLTPAGKVDRRQLLAAAGYCLPPGQAGR